MPHGDAIIHGDGIEFLGNAASGTNCVGDDLSDVFQVDVPRDELRVGVRDGDDGFAEVVVFHASGAPQGAGTCSVTANGGDF